MVNKPLFITGSLIGQICTNKCLMEEIYTFENIYFLDYDAVEL